MSRVSHLVTRLTDLSVRDGNLTPNLGASNVAIYNKKIKVETIEREKKNLSPLIKQNTKSLSPICISYENTQS
jgi:hypothetical protein